MTGNLPPADVLFASMSYELKNTGLVFHMPYKTGDDITNHFMISSSLKKDMNKNFILIGPPNVIKYLENNYSLEKIKATNYKFTNKKLLIYEVVFN